MNYKVVEGISQKNIKKLLYFSANDPLVGRFTSDHQRFKNLKAFEKWRGGGKAIYSLVDIKGDLKGIIWFSRKDMPDKKYLFKLNKSSYKITFAIRLYEEARGKGFGYNFIKTALNLFKKTTFYGNIKEKGVWIETSEDNVRAVSLYKKYGLIKCTFPDKFGKIIMIIDKKYR